MKRVLTLLLSTMMLAVMTVSAQERGANRNDFSFAVTVGYNASVMQSAVPGNQTFYSISPVPTNWNGQSLTTGVELGWFFLDLWRINLGGGFSFTDAPGYAPVPGTIDGNTEPGDGSIPYYDAVVNRNTMQYNASLGFDRYFRTDIEGLLPYVGIKAGFAYGSDIAFKDDETWMGASVAEAFNIRGAVTFGVDYYFSRGFFIGASIDPFAYTYNFTVIKPQEGLSGLAADSHNYSAFAAPTVKIGFVF